MSSGRITCVKMNAVRRRSLMKGMEMIISDAKAFKEKDMITASVNLIFKNGA